MPQPPLQPRPISSGSAPRVPTARPPVPGSTKVASAVRQPSAFQRVQPSKNK
jgi:hypothetical protein